MNRVVHFEIHAEDVERAKKFYGSVFGWEMQQTGPEFGNYIVVMTGPGVDKLDELFKSPGINGGMMKRIAPTPGTGSGPNAYVCIIEVDDIDKYIKKVEAAGGKAQTDKMNVPGVGLLRYYKDTEGNIFGMIQPQMPAK